MPSIDPHRRRAYPIAVAVECREKGSSAVPRHGIQAPKRFFLDEEWPFQRTVIAGKPHAPARRIVSAAEIGKFDSHFSPVAFVGIPNTGFQRRGIGPVVLNWAPFELKRVKSTGMRRPSLICSVCTLSM